MCDSMPEKWLPVVGYEGTYEVSCEGRVRSIDRVITLIDGRRRPTRGVVLRPAHDKDRRLVVALYGGGSRRTLRVHRLVCEAFHGPGSPDHEVRHLNDVPTDNRAVNLTWGTRFQNMADLKLNGKQYNLAKTHCARGHEYTPENTQVYYRRSKRTNMRACKACHLENARKSARAKWIKGPDPLKTHCAQGHTLAGNVYGNGRCKTCVKNQNASHRARHRTR